MKTISELQVELRTVAAQLEEISRNLSALSIGQAQQNEIDYRKLTLLGARNPIQNHCLNGRSSDLQRQYLTLLSALLQAGPAHPEDGWLFLLRIIAGSGSNFSPDALQADAATLTPEQLDQFTQAILQARLENALLLDSMLLCLVSQGEDKAKSYLAGLAELLGCGEHRVRKLIALANAVARQDRDALRTALGLCTISDLPSEKVGSGSSFPATAATLAVCLTPGAPQAGSNDHMNFDLSPLVPYLLPTLGDYLLHFPAPGTACLEGNGCTAAPKEVLDHLLQLAGGEDAHTIVIRNALFTGYPFRIQKLFYSPVKNFIMENCTVSDIKMSGSSNFCFTCNDYRTVTLTGCRFQHLSANDYTFNIENADQVNIQGTLFRDIEGRCYNSFAVRISASARLDSVTFENIKAPTGKWYVGSANTTATNCTYQNCEGETADLPSDFRKI